MKCHVGIVRVEQKGGRLTAKVLTLLMTDAIIKQEELEQWAIAAKQKEEDNLVLQKYTRSDELKIKELGLHLEKITQAVVERKSDVENEVSIHLQTHERSACHES